MAVVELLRETLHFPMRGNEDSVDGLIVENALFGWECFNSTDRLSIGMFREDVEHVLFAHRQPLERNRVMADD